MASYDGVHIGNFSKRGIRYVTLWWYTGVGSKRKAESIGRASDLPKAEVHRLRAAKEASFTRRPTLKNAVEMPALSEWWKQYKAMHTDMSPASLRVLNDAVLRMSEFWSHDPRLDQIDAQMVMEWRAWLLKTLKPRQGEKGATPSPSSIAKYMRSASTLWGSQKGAASIYKHLENPFDGQKKSAPTSVKDHPNLTREEAIALVEHAKANAGRCAIGLCVMAGLRMSEALRLQWSDIKWGKRRLVATATKNTGRNKPKQRDVLMEAELEAWLKTAKKDGLEYPCEGLNKDTIYTAMKQAQDAAGLKAWKDPFHAMRRWRESTWGAKHPGFFVALWLGHSGATALKHYLKVPEIAYSTSGRDYSILDRLTDAEWLLLTRFLENRRDIGETLSKILGKKAKKERLHKP